MLAKETIINNQYLLLEELGQGLSATVWKAQSLKNNAFYVLKIFNLSNTKRKDDFYNEWNVMQQFDLSKDLYVNFGFESFTITNPMELGIIVSEWARFGTLANLLKDINLGKERLSIDEIQDLMLKITKGLNSIHEKKNPFGQELVHRDLKPSNILLLEKTHPRISDFAISRWVDNEHITENPIGTIEYMSPEALEGQVSQSIDVWALGAIFYELLTKYPLYSRSIWPSATSLMREICNLDNPVPFNIPDNIPEKIKSILLKALSKNLDLRYASASEMLCDFSEFSEKITKIQSSSSSPSSTLINKQLLPKQTFSSTNDFEAITSNPSILTTLTKYFRLSDKRNLSFLLFLISLTSVTVLSYLYMFSFEEIALPVLPTVPPAPKELLLMDTPPEMALISAGKFFMGTNIVSISDPYERPEKEVTLKAFYLDLKEVTNEQFWAFIKANPNNPLLVRWKNWALKENEQYQPVVNVTFQEAEAYAKWLGKRLPTEEEWEYAARGNNKGTNKHYYPWGDNNKDINQYTNSQEAANDRPVKVGSYPKGKSPFGILDLAGNIAEWTTSCYTKNYLENKSIDCPDNYKIFRGGSYHDNLEYVRTTRRFWLGQLSSIKRRQEILRTIGFRCAKDYIPK